MTSQPQPTPGEVKSAGPYLRQLRDLAAYALVGATAVFLFVAIVDLIPDGDNQFGYRTQGSFGSFVNLVTIGFPIAAVVLALLVQPRHPKAQLIVLAAVIEYAVMAFFGIFFGVLLGLINEASNNGVRSAFEGLLVRLAWLAVFGVAAYAVYLIWRNLFYTPKPKPQPGVYGQPQYGAPGTYPGQPGYGPPPAQQYPGQPQGQPQGQPHPGFPPPGGQPGQPQPYGAGVYGQPAPAWNQPATTMPTPGGQPSQPVPQGTVYPSSPAGPPPAAPAPAPAAAPTPAPTDPTMVVPRSEPAETQPVPQSEPAASDDRTQKIGEDRPGFGPADPEQPRP